MSLSLRLLARRAVLALAPFLWAAAPAVAQSVPARPAPASPVPAGPWSVVAAEPARAALPPAPLERGLVWALYGVVGLVLVYTVRHYGFTLNRLFGHQRHPYAALDTLDWPAITVVIPCHNEEQVVGTGIEALLRADYPADRLTLIPLNDRSSDGTREIIDAYAARYPGRIHPFHRTGGKPGKAAALGEVMAGITTDVVLVFDADYVPGRDLLKQLAAPFCDPEVGAVMGRVVPMNTGSNLLTRLLEMERTGGYQVDQQARMNLRLVPQYGGTVGGIRRSALNAVGGWADDSLTEDTEATCRLLAGGWKVAYANRSECYEEVPETWPVRIRQIRRWARGHTAAALRHTFHVAGSRHLSARERIDGLLLLGVYAMSPVLLAGWILAAVLFYMGIVPIHGALAILAVASYNTVGNFAVFFEIATGARLDGHYRRIRLLPLNLLGFIVSLVATSRAVLTELWPIRGELVWDKTERFRRPTARPEVALARPTL
ncbi:MAG TPA: glycosyltransferase family 2 protein [Rhodothermales bacterium]|nr:glycosyltransferase family 2 protein [Rhodothermales bacterium]